MSIPGSPRRQRPAPERAGGKPGTAGSGNNPVNEQSEKGASTRAKTPVPPRGGQKRSSGGRPAAKRPKGPPRGRQAAAQAARRRRNVIAGTAVAVVVLVIAVLVIVFATSGSSGSKNDRQAIPPAELQKITTPVPMSTLNAALAKESSQNNVVAPTTLNPPGPPRIVNGKPELLYVGAEFCPICATERWPLTVALSEFGSFTNLRQIHSAADDGNIATLTYYQAGYSSSHLTFTTYEVETRNRTPLEQPPASVQSLWTNATKNIQGGPNTFPFIDMNGKWQLTSAQFTDSTFTGASFNDIANSIGNNNNTYGLYINAAAAQLVHSICGAIGNSAPVCSQTGT